MPVKQAPPFFGRGGTGKRRLNLLTQRKMIMINNDIDYLYNALPKKKKKNPLIALMYFKILLTKDLTLKTYIVTEHLIITKVPINIPSGYV